MTNPPSPPASWPGDQLVLPPLLDSIVNRLEENLGLPPAVGLAVALQTVTATVGCAVVLRDDPAPALWPCLNTVMAASPGSTLPWAVNTVLSPLRDIQARVWALTSEEPSLLTTGQPLSPVEERARRAPVIMAEDASLAALRDAGTQAFDGIVLATFTAGAWSRLQAELAAAPNGSRQRLFVDLLADHTCRGSSSGAALSLLAETRPDSEAWFGFVEALAPEACQRSLVLNPGLLPGIPRGDAVLTTELAGAWAGRIDQLFQLRATPIPLEVMLSPGARACFHGFHAELVTNAATWPARHHELVFGWATLARRLALLLHLAGGVDGPLSAASAGAGVALAKFYGAHFVSLRDGARVLKEEAEFRADCERLLTAVKQFTSTNRRTLFRRFNGQAYTRWNRVLDHLVSEGQVVQLAHDEFSVSDTLLPVRTSLV